MSNSDIEQALLNDRTIDITTTGKRSGEPRRIEIWFHNIEGRLYITGMPGRRSWYANMLANPDITFHLKGSVQADLPARVRPVTDADERRAVLGTLVRRLEREVDEEDWLRRSPLVEVKMPT